ncbi:MAG: hypothetical protein ACKVWV_08055 [Planctomycetota bacterium]
MVRSSTTFEANQELLRALAESLTAELARLAAEHDGDVLVSLRQRVHALHAGLTRHFEREHEHWSHLRSDDPGVQRWIKLQSDQHAELDALLHTFDESLGQCADPASAPCAEWASTARAIRELTLHQLSEERLFQRSVLDESYAD